MKMEFLYLFFQKPVFFKGMAFPGTYDILAYAIVVELVTRKSEVNYFCVGGGIEPGSTA